MANIETLTDENGNKVLNVQLSEDDNQITLATADTYVDKNIVININNNSSIDIATVDETLTFLNIEIPDLTQEEF